MATAAKIDEQVYDAGAIMGGLYGDGIIALKGAFPRRLGRADARGHRHAVRGGARVPGGALPRGPQRWYVEVHPERIRGFVDIATHPWFVAVCEAVLGPDYRIVEVGFDIPFPGAADQPWHRDFPSPEATLKGRRLNSLAFNLTAVDTHPGDGRVRDRAGHAVGRSRRLPGRHVPAEGALSALRRAQGRQAAADGRHLRPLGADHPSRHRQPLGRMAAGAGRRSRRARRDQRRPPRSPGHPRLSRRAAARGCATISPTGSRTSSKPVLQHHVIEGLLEPAY